MEKENDIIDFRKYSKDIKRRWWYYLIAVAFFMGLAVTYVCIKQTRYKFYSMLLIEKPDDSAPSLASSLGGVGQMMRSFSVGGLSLGSADNEMLFFYSHDMLKTMSKELGLNRMYYSKNGLSKTLLYNDTPIIVAAPDEYFDTLSTGCRIKIKTDKAGKADIKVVQGGLMGTTIAEVSGRVLPIVLNTPLGKFDILKSSKFKEGEEYNLQVDIANNDNVADFYHKELEVEEATQKSDGISLELLCANTKMGKDILNKLMDLYNARRMERKNENAQVELAFYDKQIAELSGVLSLSEQKIEDFMSDNKLTDVANEAKLLTTQNQTVKVQVLELQSQQMVCDLALKLLRDEKSKYSLLPAEGMGNMQAGEKGTNIVTQYNQLILQRNMLARSARESNIAMQELTKQIDDMRSVVIENIEQTKLALQVASNNLLGQTDKNTNRLDEMPKYKRQYFDLMRDQQLKNDLYVFLLEKRTSSALKLHSIKTLGFILDRAYRDIKPTMTKEYIVLAIALLLSVILPTVAIFVEVNRREKRKKQ